MSDDKKVIFSMSGLSKSYNNGKQVLIVYKAAYNLTSGVFNTVVGYQAMYSATTASYNTNYGWYAGVSMTTGLQNTVIGYRAGDSLTEGHKDYVPKNISSIVENISKEKGVYHLHVKTADYKDQNISNIYRYPLDRFSHLKDYSYLSKRIGNSLKNIFLIDK